MRSSISRISGSVSFLSCLAQDPFRRVFQTQPHQEEITKVDVIWHRKYSSKSWNSEMSRLHLSSEAFEQIPHFFKQRNWNCQRKRAPLIIYKYSTAPDEEKAHKSHMRETQLWIQHKSFVPIGTVKMMCKTINSFINVHFSVLKLWTALYTEKHGVEKFLTPAHNQNRMRGTIWTISCEAQLINWSQGKWGSIN